MSDEEENLKSDLPPKKEWSEPASSPVDQLSMPIEAAVQKAVDDNRDENRFKSDSSLDPCPDCETLLEPWQVTCHKCGRVISNTVLPLIENATEEAGNLDDAYKDWIAKGKKALESERYGEAQACFSEALARVGDLPNSRGKEIEVRKYLAGALEKSDKRREASEQYVYLSQLNKRKELTEEFAIRAKQLSLSTMDILSAVDKNATFRPVTASELKLVPLYCSECKRLLLEAEIYSLRKGKLSQVRCFCGAEGFPLARSDAKHLRALKTASSVRHKKSLLIQAASQEVEGRQKHIAILLAALLGTFGAHKFYLGERLAGIVYCAFCLTGLPTIISCFEAVNYSQMSRVTFNLKYNIEQVLARLPAQSDEPALEDHADVFSMEITEDCEEFVDQFSS